jgi:glutamyl-tRNA reductase
MQMLTTGVSFKTSPVSVRETVSFSESELEKALLKLSFYEGINELVILSTCNRTEFYIITSDLDLAKDSLIKFLEKEKNIDFHSIEDNFYTYYNKFAAEHLYHVVSGIDSLILGEGEILCQVKNAFTRAMEAGVTGKIFNALFKFAIETGKKVRTETTIVQRPLSTGSVVAKLAKETFAGLSSKTALLIGAGKVSQITAKNLKAQGIGELLIVNRTFEKAQLLAEELAGTALVYEKLEDALQQADIVIVCTGAPEYLINKANYSVEKPVLLIDLSIPRNVDPELAKSANITLYDLDSLENFVSLNKEERSLIIKEVETLLSEEMQKFVEWYNSLEVSPVISSLSAFFEEVRENEVSRALKKYKLSDTEKEVIDTVTKSILRKIIHYPVTNLKMTEDKELKKRYSEDLTYLFQLDSQDIYHKYFRKKDKIKTVTEQAVEKLQEPVKPNAHTPEISVCPNAPVADLAPVPEIEHRHNPDEKPRCPFAHI